MTIWKKYLIATQCYTIVLFYTNPVQAFVANYRSRLPFSEHVVDVCGMWATQILYCVCGPLRAVSDKLNINSLSNPGAFKTLDKDNNGTIKVNVQEVI